ncbi:FecR domain-containing protein [Bradyrhizobium sp. dw_78]|uniref:FecR family protein n=1 Tax=Bradyrhizobium sp. dw_78 TaxID=2719793 RepID=UPI001BD551A3|nr:FecR domain-containing protein [Bradyrhizobium sp. dw_78]
MAAPAESEDIWNEAMALLLNWQSAPDSEAMRETVRRFCAQSAEHRAAWDEARRVYRLTGDAVGAKKRAGSARKNRATSRRDVLTGLGVVLAGSAILKGPDIWRRWRSDAVTEIAEIKRQQLPDGSWLTLGPDSAVEIAFTPAIRSINLLEGMALCEVVKEFDRPFEARAGELLATAVGTVFEIRQNGGRSLAGVEEGQIRVTLDEELKSDSVTLGTNEWIAAGPSSGQLQRGVRGPGQTAAWRQNLLVADQEQIRSVVAEIGRWRRGEIVIPQSSLASAPVSGLFDLADPDAALAAVVGPYGGRVMHLSPWLTVLTSL